MLIYKNDGTLYCISKKALKLAGYNDVAEFLDEHGDYSELFVKKPGYIYNFENFSWLSFLRNANPDQKKVLIATRDNATYESELELEVVYPVEFGEGTPEFFYQINFKNLHLANGSAEPSGSFGDFSEESMAASIDLDRDLIEKEYQTFEGSIASAAPETPTVFGGETESIAAEEEPAPILFETVEESETAESAVDFVPSEPEPQTTASADEPLDLVDFSFEEEAKADSAEKSEEKTSLSFDDSALENAFAELERTPKSEKPLTKEPAEPESEVTPPAKEAENGSVFAVMTAAGTVAPVREEKSSAETAAQQLSETEAIPPEPSAAGGTLEMPDLGKAAATLGLPETMVKAFVKEFVDTYFEDIHEVKMAMESDHLAVVKKEAMKLKGIAANLLMDPMVESLETVLTSRKEAEIKAIWQEIDRYVHALAERYAPESLQETPAAVPVMQPQPVAATPAPTENKISEAPQPTLTLQLEEAGAGETIAFDPNEAANALGLPESLIIEFVNDFVTQAREEKKTFLDAYAAKDLKTVNEVAHKLKGVAANLRIEEMRTLMEEAQHADSLEEAKGPVESFYRKLGALSNTMAKEFA